MDKIRSARKVNPRRSGLQQLPIRIIQNSYYSVLLYRFFIPSWRTHTSITSLLLFLTNALTNRICIRHISLVMFSSSNQDSKYQANEVTPPCHWSMTGYVAYRLSTHSPECLLMKQTWIIYFAISVTVRIKLHTIFFCQKEFHVFLIGDYDVENPKIFTPAALFFQP